jgi:hypothetical protein
VGGGGGETGCLRAREGGGGHSVERGGGQSLFGQGNHAVLEV